MPIDDAHHRPGHLVALFVFTVTLVVFGDSPAFAATQPSVSRNLASAELFEHAISPRQLSNWNVADGSLFLGGSGVYEIGYGVTDALQVVVETELGFDASAGPADALGYGNVASLGMSWFSAGPLSLQSNLVGGVSGAVATFDVALGVENAVSVTAVDIGWFQWNLESAMLTQTDGRTPSAEVAVLSAWQASAGPVNLGAEVEAINDVTAGLSAPDVTVELGVSFNF